MGALAPVTPVPNPLRLEAVFSATLIGWSGQAYEALQLRGELVLKMLFAIVCFVENPFDDATLLKRRAEAHGSDARLASVLGQSGLLNEKLFEGAGVSGFCERFQHTSKGCA